MKRSLFAVGTTWMVLSVTSLVSAQIVTPDAQEESLDAIIWIDDSGEGESLACGCDAVDGCSGGCGLLSNLGWGGGSGWTVETDVMFLDREGGSGYEITPGFSAAEFDFDYEFTPRVALTRHNVRGSCYDFEMILFGTNDWQERATVTGATQINTVPTTFFSTEDLNLRYEAEILNVEANLRCVRDECTTLIYGFRYIDFNEQLLMSTANFPALGRVMTKNDLYGFQIGAERHLWQGRCCRATLDGTIKAGLYLNESFNKTMIDAGTLEEQWADDTSLAFAGELSLVGRYALNDCWSLRAGYELMWLEGVAIAPPQMAKSNLVTNVRSVDNNGSVLFHGALFGLEYRR